MKGTLDQEKESRVPPAASVSGLGPGSPPLPCVGFMEVTGQLAMLRGCGELAAGKTPAGCDSAMDTAVTQQALVRSVL